MAKAAAEEAEVRLLVQAAAAVTREVAAVRVSPGANVDYWNDCVTIDGEPLLFLHG